MELVAKRTFQGFLRPDGRVGARNHVIILPVDDISNAAAEGVAALIPGVMALSHPYGRIQFGPDLDLHFLTLIGTGLNPNVAGVVVIGIEPKWTARVADAIAASGKPVASFHIEGTGDLKIIGKAARAAMTILQDASTLQRQTLPLIDLVVSAKCGESDTTSGLGSNPTIGKVAERLTEAGGTYMFGETSELTGGEDIVAARIDDPADRAKFERLFREHTEVILAQQADLLGSQPTEGNIAGGLSSIEEKALGNIQKIGKARVAGVLEMGEAPTKRGLHFMDTSSAAAESVTLFAAGGAGVHLFTTGQGNIIGNPIVPVIKLTANRKTVASMEEHIDIDVSGTISLVETLDEAGERTIQMIQETASGRLTKAELLNHKEFVLTRLHRTA